MDKFKKDVHMFQKKLDSFKDGCGWCRMVRIRIHRNKKMKNVDWDKVINKSWYWTKKFFFICFVL